MFAFREESEPAATLAAPPKTNDQKAGMLQNLNKKQNKIPNPNLNPSKHNKNSQSAEPHKTVACEQNNSTTCYQWACGMWQPGVSEHPWPFCILVGQNMFHTF